MHIVLSIDVDAFVDPPAHDRNDVDRLPDDAHAVWPTERVHDFLVNSCGLHPDRPVRGAVIEHHDEIMPVIEREIQNGSLSTPFRLVHLDAHSDIWSGPLDEAWVELLRDFAHRPLHDRARRGARMNAGNWLAYMVMRRWVGDIIHARQRYRQGGGSAALRDIHGYYIAGESVDRVDLHLVPLGEQEPISRSSSEFHREMANIRRSHPEEPVVPMHLVRLAELVALEHPTFVVLCRSPGFTPPKADVLIGVISGFILVD